MRLNSVRVKSLDEVIRDIPTELREEFLDVRSRLIEYCDFDLLAFLYCELTSITEIQLKQTSEDISIEEPIARVIAEDLIMKALTDKCFAKEGKDNPEVINVNLLRFFRVILTAISFVIIFVSKHSDREDVVIHREIRGT